MYSNVVSAIAEALWQHDISTLRFNFRGTGASTGSHGDGDTEGADVAAAVAYLLSCQPIAGQTVAGYSFGAEWDSWPAPPMRVWQLWLG